MTKRTIFTIAAIAVAFTLSSCAGTYQKGDRMPETTNSQVDSISYALGMYFGNMIKGTPFGELNLNQVDKGFYDVIGGKETKIKEEEIGMMIQTYLMERQSFVANREKEKGEDFLLKNKDKEGVVETESGLQYKIIIEGSGISPESTDSVEVHYEGKLIDGTVFDSSYEASEPVKFALDRVIKGWTEGLKYAKEGGKIELYIPASLAYGPRGSGPIPGNSTLIFNVELIKVYKDSSLEEKK